MSKIKYKIIFAIFIIAGAALRFSALDKVPVSLYYDEVDVGYQAYSLLKTGKDYFGNTLPLQVRSYQEFRTPFNIYASIPTVAIFGISPYGIRLPAAIFGVASIFGMFFMTRELLKTDKSLSKTFVGISSLAAVAILSFNPWHIQYSRVPLEVTSFLTFLLFGLYFFIKSLKKPNMLVFSAACLFLTPWIYSTAKFFMPFFMAFLIILYFKELIKYPKNVLARSIIISLILSVPLIFVTVKGQASSRFSYISIFTNPVTASEVNYQRQYDAVFRQETMQDNFYQKVVSRLVHNKYSFWGKNFSDNYIRSFSTDFLFINGDPNLRHSPQGVGQFFKIEFFSLLAGVLFFFTRYKDKKIKLMIVSWILLGILPTSITRDGAAHATRLIIILPPLVFLMSYGLVFSLSNLKNASFAKVCAGVYTMIWLAEFLVYQHIYWIHYPWYSERSFSSSYRQVVEYVKEMQKDYSKIIISNAHEDPKIFFAGYYPIDPSVWQKGLKEGSIGGFGNLQGIEKYYFGQPQIPVSNEDFADIFEKDILYIASDREFSSNLNDKPADIPNGLSLLKTIFYPSGEPAFYAFERSDI